MSNALIFGPNSKKVERVSQKLFSRGFTLHSGPMTDKNLSYTRGVRLRASAEGPESAMYGIAMANLIDSADYDVTRSHKMRYLNSSRNVVQVSHPAIDAASMAFASKVGFSPEDKERHTDIFRNFFNMLGDDFYFYLVDSTFPEAARDFNLEKKFTPNTIDLFHSQYNRYRAYQHGILAPANTAKLDPTWNADRMAGRISLDTIWQPDAQVREQGILETAY